MDVEAIKKELELLPNMTIKFIRDKLIEDYKIQRENQKKIN